MPTLGAADLSQPAQIDDLARRLGGPLARYFGARVRGGVDIEDLVQEVFLRLARRSETEPIESLEGYVFVIANSKLRLGVRNITDKDPPLSSAGYDGTVYLPYARYWYVSVKKTF